MQEDLEEVPDLGVAGLPWPAEVGKGLALAYGGVVIDPRGRFLLREVRGHYDNYVWTFAKGRPEKGESARQAAVREVAEDMDEKWFVYVENCVLHMHRSWTGFCIFRVHFTLTAHGWYSTHVEVNRHSGQYGDNVDAEALRLAQDVLTLLLQKIRP
jgi:ADP-ribose pyrophosphatase YjhB (NUDIX family)